MIGSKLLAIWLELTQGCVAHVTNKHLLSIFINFTAIALLFMVIEVIERRVVRYFHSCAWMKPNKTLPNDSELPISCRQVMK